MPLAIEKEFEFTFSCKDVTSKLSVPVPIPLPQTVDDFAGRLIGCHNLPCYVVDDLKRKLEHFITIETQNLHDVNAEEALSKIRDGTTDIDNLVEKWTKAYTQEVKQHAKVEEASEEALFSEVYHNLIHSPALDTLLNLEHTYALTIEDLIDQRDKDLHHLEERQREEMEEAVQNVGKTYRDDEINMLAQRHFENSQVHV